MGIDRRSALTAMATTVVAATALFDGIGASAMDGTGKSSGTATRSPVTRPGAEQWDMTSKVTGRTYRIYVAKPVGVPAAPSGGYPVIYLTDGDFEFQTAADALALQTLMGEVKPAYLVGIGYGGEWGDVSRLRFADLTPVAPDAVMLDRFAKSPMMGGATFGQAERFHHFMVDELRPMIASSYPVNHQNSSLFGHSLGGLFALHVLFNYPESYRSYLAASPSINWAGGAVLKDEDKLVARLKAGDVAPRLLITVGELEEKLAPNKVPPPGMTREQVQAGLKAFAAVTNAVALADRLKGVAALAESVIENIVFEGETHASVVAAAISRGVRFADAL